MLKELINKIWGKIKLKNLKKIFETGQRVILRNGEVLLVMCNVKTRIYGKQSFILAKNSLFMISDNYKKNLIINTLQNMMLCQFIIYLMRVVVAEDVIF